MPPGTLLAFSGSAAQSFSPFADAPLAAAVLPVARHY
jgi:hypothetical protein